MNIRTFTHSFAALAVSIFIFSAGVAQGTTYTWTGATDGDWTKPGNWDASGSPVDTRGASAGLDLDAANDQIVFNASGSANPVPTANIPSFSWYAFQGTADTPIVAITYGSLAFTGDGSFQDGFGGNQNITWGTVGDGDIGNGTASLTYNNFVRLGRSGRATWIVNADGTLIFTDTAGLEFDNSPSSKPAWIILNGGSATTAGPLTNLATTQGSANPSYVEFNDITSSFTADFGGEFSLLTDVQAQLGSNLSFRPGGSLLANPYANLVASDNGNGTFTVAAEIPEPSTAILAGLALMGVCFRRR